MEPSPHKAPVPNMAPSLPRSSPGNGNLHKRSRSNITLPPLPWGISSGESIPFHHRPHYYYYHPHYRPTGNPQDLLHHMSGFQAQQFAANSNNKDHFNRKRQRKLAAAATIVPDSIWNNSVNNNNNMGRKSTAQPRPVLYIPPRGIGPIVEPNENDVLCGKSALILFPRKLKRLGMSILKPLVHFCFCCFRSRRSHQFPFGKCEVS
jgi:hypothetical protein